MNKNLLLIVGLIAAGAIGAFLFLKKPLPGGGTMVSGGQETVSSSFADLMKMGKDYMCTFSTTDETTGTTNGTVYVADQGTKFSGSFTSTAPNGTETQSNVIRSGEYTYVWMPPQKEGFKMKIDPEDESLFGQTQDNEDTEQTALDEDQPMDFNCQPWRPDQSMFTPPSDVVFTDFSAQMEAAQEQMESVQNNGANCSLCDQAPEGQARTQCLAMMGC